MQNLTESNSGQVLVSYSDIRKQELDTHAKHNCNALANLVKLLMEKDQLSVKSIEKNANDGKADIVIDFDVSNQQNLEHFKDVIIKKLLERKVGAKNIEVFLK